MKERLDKLIIEKNILDTRERAKAFIMGGSITVNGERVRKPGTLIEVDSVIKVQRTNNGYVSRGGIKLAGALKEFTIEIKGAYCLDIGASTGGFADCLLQNGAGYIIAVDVGKNQIAYKLRNNPQIRVIEKFNARYIDRLEIDRSPDIVTIDVSFISIRYIVKPLLRIVDLHTDILALIKPQYELERPCIGFKGVVRDADVHKMVLLKLHDFFLTQGFEVKAYCFSPLKGPKGNIEFFVHLKPFYRAPAPESRSAGREISGNTAIDKVIENAHTYFKGHQRRSG